MWGGGSQRGVILNACDFIWTDGQSKSCLGFLSSKLSWRFTNTSHSKPMGNSATVCKMTEGDADIALIGLAVMGQNLILNMNDHGFKVMNVSCIQLSLWPCRWWRTTGPPARWTTSWTTRWVTLSCKRREVSLFLFVLGEGDKCGGSPLLGGDGGEAEASKAGDDPRQGRSCCRRLHRQAGSPDGEGERKPLKNRVDTNCRVTLSSTEETRSTRTPRGEQRLWVRREFSSLDPESPVEKREPGEKIFFCSPYQLDLIVHWIRIWIWFFVLSSILLSMFRPPCASCPLQYNFPGTVLPWCLEATQQPGRPSNQSSRWLPFHVITLWANIFSDSFLHL